MAVKLDLKTQCWSQVYVIIVMHIYPDDAIDANKKAGKRDKELIF